METLDEGLKAPDGLAQSLRVDLCTIALAQLDRTLEDPDPEKVVDKLLEVYYVPRRNLAAKVQRPRACGASPTAGWTSTAGRSCCCWAIIPGRSIRRPPRG